MTETRPGQVGPWGAVGDVPPRPAPVRPRADKDENPGQNLVWALVSTALLAGLLWWLMGWVYALAGIVGLLVHEYGHVLAMNRLGMGPAKIYIIPFLGGVAKSQRLPQSEWHGVLVSLAGPAFGLLAAIPFFALFLVTGQAMWLNGVFIIAFINLVNLAPAPPLDGSKALGPVLARIHPMLEKVTVGLIGLVVVIWGVTNGSWPFAIFLALALIGHLRRGAWRPDGRPLSLGESGRSVGLFLLTTAACAGVALAALMPVSGSLPEALSLGARFFEFGR